MVPNRVNRKKDLLGVPCPGVLLGTYGVLAFKSSTKSTAADFLQLLDTTVESRETVMLIEEGSQCPLVN